MSQQPSKWDRIKQRTWNKEDPRVILPQSYGWGFSINLYAIGRRLGLADRTTSRGGSPPDGGAAPHSGPDPQS